MKSTLAAILLGGITSLMAQAAIQETQAVAERSLATFHKLVNKQNFRSMGFKSPEDVASAKLAQPMAMFMVELNDLRSYQDEADPNRLLKPLDKVIYPVTIDEEVRSSVTVEKIKGQWQASNFGSPNLAKLLAGARDTGIKETRLRKDAFFVVQIPALNALFLGYRVEEKLMLASVLDDPVLKINAGKSMLASEVFAALAPAAREHNGLPR